MVISKALIVALCAVLFLTGCSFNQTMFESDRAVDIDHISKDYGNTDPGATIAIQL